ncbi:MAG: class I SAM-dependent methyltransferase [Desulfobacterales bacterium]
MTEATPRFWEVFFEVFEALPRQGPGNRDCAARALALCRDLPSQPSVLDMGCGVGGQTLHLAELTSGFIVAIDNHAPFIDRLTATVAARGLTQRIRPLVADMTATGLPPASFDLVWSPKRSPLSIRSSGSPYPTAYTRTTTPTSSSWFAGRNEAASSSGNESITAVKPTISKNTSSSITTRKIPQKDKGDPPGFRLRNKLIFLAEILHWKSHKPDGSIRRGHGKFWSGKVCICKRIYRKKRNY